MLRIGIDVGGTFTDVVAIDVAARTIVARVKVPTTHAAADGVAIGIAEGIRQILRSPAVDPHAIAFIAHSTTQATNALLEGDVAPVGVLGLTSRAGALARRWMRFGAIALGPETRFDPAFAFARADDPASVRRALDVLLARGVAAVAVSAPFGVDDCEPERAATESARARGVFATAGHEVTTGYGLRARTRTAAVNAAILPRMVRTARTTATAVAEAAIRSPLMVMRSDGGVMDVREIERRPVLTLLSGPAAGIAGALLHERCADGIFVEVGGTSSDCSAIRDGRPQMHPARIGGHRMMLRTLDVRTLGIGGGSLARVRGGAIVEVGPRSAHIAGYRYACFLASADLDGAEVDDGAYAALRLRDGSRAALTPTCAANLLGEVPDGAFARAPGDAAARAFSRWSERWGSDPREVARALLQRAAARLRAGIDELIADYELDRTQVCVIGGGGGAGALVPFAAREAGLPFRIARDAEVISPVGVALALVRETIERTVVDPSAAEVAAIRREAADRVIAAGADPQRVEVVVEFELRRNLVRATASGATASAEPFDLAPADDAERRDAAARALGCTPDDLVQHELNDDVTAYARGDALCVVDRRGVVVVSLHGALVCRTSVARLEVDATDAIEAATRFGDIGRALPDVYLVRGARTMTFVGMTSTRQAVALLGEEVDGAPPDAALALILHPHRA